MKKKNVGIVIIFLLVGAGVIGLYYYFLTHNSNKEEDLTDKKTAVQELIDMDLDNYYPATVNTVLETYSKFCQAFYNEDYKEDEYKLMMNQYRKLMDDELLANNPEDVQLVVLNQDIESFQDDNKVIFSYRFVDDPENKESTIDGKSYATKTMSFGVKKGSSSVETTEEVFILRKDSKDRWKILGWKLRDKKNISASPSVVPSVSPKTKE